MSSNIRITRICEHCGNAWEARKTTSRYCSDACSKQAYKVRQRAEKIARSDEQTRKVIEKPITDLRANEVLTVDESARLLRISRRTLYRLIEREEIRVIKLGRRTVIHRDTVDKLFVTPPPEVKTAIAEQVPVAECYTMKEVLSKYPISEKALYELVRREKIPRQYKGKFAYVPKSRIDELLNATLSAQ